MKKTKLFLFLISLLLLCESIFAANVYAEASENTDTYKYYFLAPDEYIDNNGSVGAYWNNPENTATYQNVEMTKEWNVGRNVFSVEVPSTVDTIVFNSYAASPGGYSASDYRNTVNISLNGYKKGCDADNGGCPYNDSIGIDNFNGWIYVLNNNASPDEGSQEHHADQGAWFELDYYYYNHKDYFMTYEFKYRENPNLVESDIYTYYFLAPEDWCMKEYGALNEDIGCYLFWFKDEYCEWPGVKMIPAPEIGQNVFKVNLPKEISESNKPFQMILNDGFKYNSPIEMSEMTYPEYTPNTQVIVLEGYDVLDSSMLGYDPGMETPNFNGWIFVLDRSFDLSNGWDDTCRYGGWFPLNNYKIYDKYYGSYPDWYNEEERKFGDLDADENITVSDALEVLRLSVGIEFYNDFTLSIADADQNGSLTSADALEILRLSLEDK